MTSTFENGNKGYVSVPQDDPTNSPFKTKCRKFGAAIAEQPFFGICLAATSSFFFFLCSLIVKRLKYLSPSQLAIYRFIGMFIPTLVLVNCMKIDSFHENLKWKILFRGITGSLGLMLQFYAFQNLPLGDATVIIFSLPVFVTILGRIFLKEYCSVLTIVCIICTTLGVLLIIRPPFIFGLKESDVYEGRRFYGALAALSSVLMGSIAYVLIRMLREMHYFAVMFDFSVVGLVCMSIQSAATKSFGFPSCHFDLMLVSGLGLFSFIGQVLFTKALQIEQAGLVSIARTVDIVFAFVWQTFWSRDIPNILSISGSILVTSSVFSLGFVKWISSLPDVHKAKQMFRCLLK